MASPTPRPGILDIKPYVPGSSEAPGATRIFKMSSNESALGPSPKAMEAFEAASRDLHLYPDGASTALREQLAEIYDLDAGRIVCGAGSDELLQLLTKAYVGEGDNIVQTDHGFLVYALAAMGNGGEPRFAPEKNLTADVDEMLKLVDDKTRIVFLANPNNPTGTYIPDSEVRRLRENLREDVILVIDSAYAEYMEEPDYADGAAMVDDFDNVVMTRTFSKIYGLGGMRLGWAYFPAAIADVINRIRGPFNVSAPAIAAGVAALEDTDFVAKNLEFNRRERDWLQQQLGGLGLDFVPSYGNFILVKFPVTPGKNANDIQSYLRAGGVIVREVGAYKLGEYLRISIGEEDGNRKLIELLREKFGNE
ncbi:MAG: histidinol-phosphate transaminase [Marinicaulis sp.]|nr:histidinol-phosphate transaminase [Marinicaulis sp.]NNE39986.1 histidinol-phosphate transaminase [Marinicaulis sp.]NNL89587.1 histidinol-phosphate transaminase [Marinicaulis sp.]